MDLAALKYSCGAISSPPPPPRIGQEATIPYSPFRKTDNAPGVCWPGHSLNDKKSISLRSLETRPSPEIAAICNTHFSPTPLVEHPYPMHFVARKCDRLQRVPGLGVLAGFRTSRELMIT